MICNSIDKRMKTSSLQSDLLTRRYTIKLTDNIHINDTIDRELCLIYKGIYLSITLH